jgi:hypothetical protein
LQKLERFNPVFCVPYIAKSYHLGYVQISTAKNKQSSHYLLSFSFNCFCRRYASI